MRVDFGLVLGILLEYILLIYYANTTFYAKDNYYKSSIVALVGYILLFAVGTFGYAFLSISAFFVINFLIFILCYDIGYRNAIFQSMALNIISIVGEYIIVFVLNVNINVNGKCQISPEQSLILSIISKIIYFIGIIIMKKLMDKKLDKSEESMITLIFILMTTTVCLIIMSIVQVDNPLFLVLCILLLVIDIGIFTINEIMNSYKRKLQLLRVEQAQNNIELEEYKLLSEKYEQTCIMRHDFKKQINSIKQLAAVDSVNTQKYLDDMNYALKELNFIQYTDNKILNILLSQKTKECHQYGIDLNIHSTNPSLSFLSEIDTVAIFSNLIDNAIEGCNRSKDKSIFIDLDTINDTFTIIKIENNSDIAPKVVNDRLVTQKKDKDLHGVGMKSIRNSLQKYKGNLEWSYNKENKIFCTIVMLKINDSNHK